MISGQVNLLLGFGAIWWGWEQGWWRECFSTSLVEPNTIADTEGWGVILGFSKESAGSISSVDSSPTSSREFKRKAVPLLTTESWDAPASVSAEKTIKVTGFPDVESEWDLLSGIFPEPSGLQRVKVKRQWQRVKVVKCQAGLSIFRLSIHHPSVHSSHPSFNLFWSLFCIWLWALGWGYRRECQRSLSSETTLRLSLSSNSGSCFSWNFSLSENDDLFVYLYGDWLIACLLPWDIDPIRAETLFSCSQACSQCLPWCLASGDKTTWPQGA